MNKNEIRSGAIIHAIGGPVAVSAPAIMKEMSKTLTMRLEMAEQAKKNQPKLEWCPFTHNWVWR